MAGMAARRGGAPITSAQPPKLDPTLDDTSSEEDIVHVADDDSSDSDFGQEDGDNSMDDGDEFDPYAPPSFLVHQLIAPNLVSLRLHVPTACIWTMPQSPLHPSILQLLWQPLPGRG